MFWPTCTNCPPAENLNEMPGEGVQDWAWVQLFEFQTVHILRAFGNPFWFPVEKEALEIQ